jgi:trans-aconitate methyltransferase
MDQFHRAGYTQVYGVESSEAMRARSLYQDRVTLSSSLPQGPWDVVLANWTLHFIEDRLSYLARIYQELAEGGLLILSDKMQYTPLLEQLYWAFKRDQGVSLEEIQDKARAIQGLLTVKSLSWYMDSLADLGFKDIQVVNSRLMFHTVMAVK